MAPILGDFLRFGPQQNVALTYERQVSEEIQYPPLCLTFRRMSVAAPWLRQKMEFLVTGSRQKIRDFDWDRVQDLCL